MLAAGTTDADNTSDTSNVNEEAGGAVAHSWTYKTNGADWPTDTHIAGN